MGLVSCWVDVAQVVAALPGFRLERFAPFWELKERPEPGGLIPDARVHLQLPAVTGAPRSAALALGLDRGTESVPRFKEKLQRYLLSDADPVLAVVLVGAAPRRRAAIQDVLATHWPGTALLWSDRDGPRAELARLAALPLQPALADSPSGKGSPTPATCTFPTKLARPASRLFGNVET